MIVKSIPLTRILRFREVNLYKTTKVANTQNYKEKKSNIATKSGSFRETKEPQDILPKIEFILL